MKKTLAMFVLTLILLMNGAFVSGVQAAGNSGLGEVYKAYNKVLDQQDGGNAFNVIDINKDGIPELIVDSLRVYTYTDHGLENLFDSMVLCTFYYSEESKYVLYYYGWQEEENWSIYEIDSSKKGIDNSSVHFVAAYARQGTDYSYQAVYGEEPVATTMEEANNKINELIPNKIKIEMTYANTADNRSKYLFAQPEIVAEPTASKVLVDGKEVNFQAYMIDGNNYFKLRDIASVLNHTPKGFEIEWDNNLRTIALTTGKPYTPTGEELTVSQDIGKQEAKPTTSKIFLNNKEVEFVAYNINGYNYFKLRDLGKAINFGVTWDSANEAILVQTSEVYKEEQ